MRQAKDTRKEGRDATFATHTYARDKKGRYVCHSAARYLPKIYSPAIRSQQPATQPLIMVFGRSKDNKAGGRYGPETDVERNEISGGERTSFEEIDIGDDGPDHGEFVGAIIHLHP